jgi:hypothetical protein
MVDEVQSREKKRKEPSNSGKNSSKEEVSSAPRHKEVTRRSRTRSQAPNYKESSSAESDDHGSENGSESEESEDQTFPASKKRKETTQSFEDILREELERGLQNNEKPRGKKQGGGEKQQPKPPTKTSNQTKRS